MQLFDPVTFKTSCAHSRIVNSSGLPMLTGKGSSDFESRRKHDFWENLVDTIPEWDRQIELFNAEIGRNASA